MVLVAAGALGSVLIDHMYIKNENVTYIDVDGLLDKGHRAHFSKPADQIVSSEQAASGGIRGCTMTKYVREGDCAKPPSDVALSRLCFPKGAHKQAKAGRIGGYFSDEHNMRKRGKRGAGQAGQGTQVGGSVT